MAGMNLKIEPSILNWMIQKVQFYDVNNSVVELLLKWQSGEKVPTFNQIEDVSKKINIPFGYFFLKTPPEDECKIIEFRTVESMGLQEPSRNLLDTVDAMSDAQEWMKGFLRDNGAEELSFVGKYNKEANKDDIVDDIRRVLNLEEDWFNQTDSITGSFKYLRERCENAGILVMMSGIVGQNTRRKLSISEFRAFTLIDRYAPLVFINTCDTEGGKIFSLLHELAHIWTGTESLYNDQFGNTENVSSLEKVCNETAAEILVPQKLFYKKWKEQTLDMRDKVADLAKYFKCSQYVIVRKALDSSFISKKSYADLVDQLTLDYKKWQEQRNKKSSGGDYYKNMGAKLDHRFIRALAGSAKEGRTQYTDAYRLTNTNRKTFSRLADEIGGVRW
ncbi:ImmA/IrrE family metallo-endopeptidase [Clostridium sp. MCC353]|uniref:ImmA/IrrE family metallo-endopeptidase n=1 Tax=Clostridium sp. MCC353 TaxID=2592646 RepID=UPI001C036775|nr:ImmA/IrrE family metallo-endopeptidase [Clostridium sp. MCC353]MBT9775172.1 ImmA/IrrE family metallo-endopeptidase [Clostridium sp. MCC353]